MVERTFRKFCQAAYIPVLTYSRCTCPPALDTFVSALEGFVTGGLAFPSGQSQVLLISSLYTDYYNRHFGSRPTHAPSDLYCDAAKLRRRGWKRCWLSSSQYDVERAANSAAVRSLKNKGLGLPILLKFTNISVVPCNGTIQLSSTYYVCNIIEFLPIDLLERNTLCVLDSSLRHNCKATSWRQFGQQTYPSQRIPG